MAGGHLPLDQEKPSRTSAKRDKTRFSPLILALRVRAAGEVSLMMAAGKIPSPALCWSQVPPLTSSLDTVMTCPGGPGGPGGPGSPTPSWPRSPWKTRAISPGPPLAGPRPQPGGTHLLTGAAFVTFGSLERGAGRSEHHMEPGSGSQVETPSHLQLQKILQATSASSSRQRARLR